MPTYLCHGFRWDRKGVIHLTLAYNIEESSPDWVIQRGSPEAILACIQQKYPYVPSRIIDAEKGTLGLADLELLEEYSLTNEASWTTPYCYLADHVVEVETGVNVAEEMEAYEKRTNRGEEGWFEKLRGELLGVGEAKIGWYVVVCEDEERDWPRDTQSVEEENGDKEDSASSSRRTENGTSSTTRTSRDNGSEKWPKPPPMPTEAPRKGIRKMRSGLNLRRILPLGKKKEEQRQETAQE